MLQTPFPEYPRKGKHVTVDSIYLIFYRLAALYDLEQSTKTNPGMMQNKIIGMRKRLWGRLTEAEMRISHLENKNLKIQKRTGNSLRQDQNPWETDHWVGRPQQQLYIWPSWSHRRHCHFLCGLSWVLDSKHPGHQIWQRVCDSESP